MKRPLFSSIVNSATSAVARSLKLLLISQYALSLLGGRLQLKKGVHAIVPACAQLKNAITRAKGRIDKAVLQYPVDKYCKANVSGCTESRSFK